MATTIPRLKYSFKEALNKHPLSLHFLATIFVFISAYWNIDAELLFKHTLFLIPAVLLPGLAVLVSLEGLKVEVPYILGISFAFGLILQSLNFFLLSLTHNIQYFTVTISLIFIFSSYCIFIKRENILISIRSSSFDFSNLTFYVALILALSLLRINFSGPFDVSITGYAWSPLHEIHANIYSAYSLSNASGFPYSVYRPPSQPLPITHPSMPGIILAMLNPNGQFPHYFAQFQCVILGSYSKACMLAFCATRIFNKFAAVLATTAFTVYLAPYAFFEDAPWFFSHSFLYFPQHLVVLASLAFLLTTIAYDKQNHEPSTAYFFIVTMIAAFACSVNFQFLAVIFPTFLVYFSWQIVKGKSFWDKASWILPITVVTLAFWYMLHLGGKVYPIRTIKGEHLVLYFKWIGNLGVFLKGDDLKNHFWLLFHTGFGFAVLGIFWLLEPILRFGRIKHKPSHLFLLLGISSSMFCGTFITLEAGHSGIYFYFFAIFFLFVYGVAVVSRRKIIAQSLTWIIIVGICIFPEYSRLNHQDSSRPVSTDLYRFGRGLSDLLPDKARVVWAGEWPDRPNAGVIERFSCAWFVGRKCVYSNNLTRDVIFTKATHIISYKDLSQNTERGHIGIRLGVDDANSTGESYDSGGDFYGPAALITSTIGSSDMTANTSPSGTSVGQTETAAAWKAFDRVTSGESNHWLDSGLPTWVQYQFDNGLSAKVINSYDVVSADSAAQSPDTWTLEASNTGAFSGEEVVLDTQTNNDFTATFQTKNFTFANTTAYIYYRLAITALTGGGTTTAVGELKLYEAAAVNNITLVAEPVSKRLQLEIPPVKSHDIPSLTYFWTRFLTGFPPLKSPIYIYKLNNYE